MVRTGDSHSPDRGSIPLTAVFINILRVFILGIEPVITFVMRGPPLEKRYLIVFLGRVLTAVFINILRVFILGIEPVITFVMRGPPLEKRYLIVFLGRVSTRIKKKTSCFGGLF